MISRLGKKYDIDIKIISKAREQYSTAEYLAQKLPKAPAIMIGDEVMVEGSDVSDDKLEAVICNYLGTPAPKPPESGIFSCF